MKKCLLTCAALLALTTGVLFVVFTFENMLFALARIQSLPTSASYHGNFIGKESDERTSPDRPVMEELQNADCPALAGAYENSALAMAVIEVAEVEFQ